MGKALHRQQTFGAVCMCMQVHQNEMMPVERTHPPLPTTHTPHGSPAPPDPPLSFLTPFPFSCRTSIDSAANHTANHTHMRLVPTVSYPLYMTFLATFHTQHTTCLLRCFHTTPTGYKHTLDPTGQAPSKPPSCFVDFGRAEASRNVLSAIQAVLYYPHPTR